MYNKENVEIKSKKIEGVMRTPLFFVIGGISGIITNILLTVLDIKTEQVKQNNREKSINTILTSSGEKHKQAKFTNEERVEMKRKYNDIFKPLKRNMVPILNIDKNNYDISETGNKKYKCNFKFVDDSENKSGIVLSGYDFWKEYYKYSCNGNLRLLRIYNGTDYMCFTLDDKFYYIGEDF